MAKPVFIYALCEPGTRIVRYIGQTNSLKKRLRQHVRTSTKKKSALGDWLRGLSKWPVLVVLHEVAETELWQEEECRYISCARALGMNLVNSTDGGDGVSCMRSPEWRAAIGTANRGVPKSPQHRAAIRAAGIGRKASAEARANMSAAKKGVSKSPEHRAALGDANRGKKRTVEQRAVLSIIHTGLPWSPARRIAYEKRWGAK